MKKNIFLSLIVLIFFGSITHAGSWELPGIDLVERAQRGAQEGRKYRESGRYDKIKKRNDDYALWLEGKGEDMGGFEQRKKNQELNSKRYDYLETHHPSDIKTFGKITEEGGKNLVWNQEFAHKKKIIVHHTADSISYNSPDDVRNAMLHFYELHVLKHGRGDLGYNFLIDPFGTVYEGRSGGEGVVGAHADWNNASTIGISLMGNFDIKKPTSQALQTLIKLSTILSYKYAITPTKQEPYFTPIKEEPYLQVAYHDSIVGHQDTKNTACPGEHLYEAIPLLKREVQQRLLWLLSAGVKKLTHDHFMTVDKTYLLDEDEGLIRIPSFNRSSEVTCKSFGDEAMIQKCFYHAGRIFLKINKRGSGLKTIGITQGKQSKFVELLLLWEDDLQEELHARKDTVSLAKTSSKGKIIDKISLTQAREFAQKDISVLLYELTSDYDEREIRCDGSCTVIVDGAVLKDPQIITIKKNLVDDSLDAFIDLKKYPTRKFGVITNSGHIIVENYGRKVGEHELNLFRGSLTITQGLYKHLDQGVQKDYVVVNTIAFSDYLDGIGESSEYQHPNKTRILSLLAKQYALYYRSGSNRHPSVPEGAAYTAIDDARLFQKFVGAGRESYAKSRKSAVKDTQDIYVTYNGRIPILPYFHCSAGFTLSGKEKFGRTDTPRLKGVLDVTSCESGQFEGHGVGLSGDGAEKLAQAGASFDEIIHRYFDDVEIVR